jgi:large subunit ribosomal protein L19
MDLIKSIEAAQLKTDLVKFNVGDTIKVNFKIIEGKAERIQAYEGLVLCFRGAGASKTFTVRKNSYGVGVERVFPLNSPRIQSVEVVRAGKVRRAKLYYIRGKVGKAARIKTLLNVVKHETAEPAKA